MKIALYCWVVFAALLNPSVSHAQPTVRVLTVVTNEALQYLGATSATSLAIGEINKTNSALTTSKINLRVELAGVVQLSMPMPLSVVDTVKMAQKNLTILGTRDAVNADVVIVIHRTAAFSGTVLVIGPTDPKDAFASIHAEQTKGALYGYAHELGHLFGATHQDTGGAPDAVGNTGNTPNGQGYYFRYNVWYTQPSITTPYCKHTLMAYPPVNVLKGVDCTSQPSIHLLVFSTPTVCENNWYVNGVLTPLCYGDSTHNNTVVVGQKGPTLINFRNTKLRPRAVAEVVQSILFNLGLLDPPLSCSPNC
jgi:Metallo-peptidase family M12